MARRPRKRSRWPIALAELLLLPCLIATATRAMAVEASISSVADEGSALAIDPVGAMAAIEATDLYLDLTLNGTPRGLVHLATGTASCGRRATLQQLGSQAGGHRRGSGSADSLPGVQVSYERATAVSHAYSTAAVAAP